jgi:hypothetical protein
MKLENLLRFAGALHFCVLTASGLVPFKLQWRASLAPLHPFLRRLFWVYGAFIVLCIASFGILTLAHARAMAAGDAVARSLAAFIAVFWLLRLGVQFFVFDPRPFLTNRFYKLGYLALTVVFTYFALVYGWAALRGGKGLFR